MYILVFLFDLSALADLAGKFDKFSLFGVEGLFVGILLVTARAICLAKDGIFDGGVGNLGEKIKINIGKIIK